MLYKLKPVEAMQVPVPLEHEAAKDLEARYAKLCAWLDEKGMVDIDFEMPKKSHDLGLPGFPGSVMWRYPNQVYARLGGSKDWGPLSSEGAVEGFYIVWVPQLERFHLQTNESFTALYELY